MPDHDDDLRRLRAADPIDHDSLPSAQEPKARELFERITMRNPTPLTRRPLWLAAAAVVLVAAAGTAIAVRDDDKPSRGATATSTTPVPITPGGSIGSCVEMYTLDTLKHRETAFDGTVRRVEGDTIEFTVNAWYRGGSGATTTREGASTLGGISSAGPSVSLEPGTRLLVAGDGGFAWGCGFTQPYDEAVAQQWSEAFAE